LLPSRSYSLVVTDNLAFVSGWDKTVAIDLATHRQVWEYPASGQLSISNRGVLYIGGEGGKIIAINLR
jgi:outer membrane protein assembly factor BamB